MQWLRRLRESSPVDDAKIAVADLAAHRASDSRLFAGLPVISIPTAPTKPDDSQCLTEALAPIRR
jgi:hypothetical protein